MKSLIILIALVFAFTNLAVSQETEEAVIAEIKIVDAKLGTGVEDRMIVGEDSTFALDSKVYFWLKVSGAANQDIIIIWKQNDFAHQAELHIGGSPWRTWAVKTVHKTGEWVVTATDSQGNVLKEMSFTVK